MSADQTGPRPHRRTALKGGILSAAVAASAMIPAPASAAEHTGRHDPLVHRPVPEQLPVTEGHADVAGGQLYYWDTGGEGPAVVLAHAGTGSALAWPYQQPVLARAGYRVISYSRRGHYRSSAATADDPPAADDLLALTEHLNVPAFHLVGTALGGFLAVDFAVTHPSKLRSLVLVNSQLGIQEADYEETLARIRPPEFEDLPHSYRELGAAYRAVAPDGVHAWERITELSRPGPANPRPRLIHTMTWKLLATISARTLMTVGDADLYLPPPLGRTVAAHLPDVSLLTFSEAGHAPQWERPSDFNRQLLRFLSGARFPADSRC
ncbi:MULTISPECIES: alpha/beta fold hydrolase [Streptomyces]|uniref:alpha/beta fold hydrolase n=1 Tax=Streptomyces lycopersici TaxID=2974589 RepID=UPI0021CF8F59|nr:alpha/beta hydrolase [Streptomyces sp. NEAU-383]